VDLIFGIPGQTLAEWRADLETVLELGVGHVSTYGLTYEKGTRLWKAWQRGLITPSENELEAQMYELAMDRLTAGGVEQYEISNFARPGQQCRHNELYWANAPYFGIGLGAARYLGGTRAVNTRSLKTYLDACLAGQDPQQSAETLPPDQRARETAMLNLRRRRGIHRQEFLRQTGIELDNLLGARLRRLVDQGLLIDAGEAVFLSRQGRLLADEVLGAVLTTP
jgi:oxygen-independent coproporphyrinogen-3 oxidase